jgi:hypothetical protein
MAPLPEPANTSWPFSFTPQDWEQTPRAVQALVRLGMTLGHRVACRPCHGLSQELAFLLGSCLGGAVSSIYLSPAARPSRDTHGRTMDRAG